MQVPRQKQQSVYSANACTIRSRARSNVALGQARFIRIKPLPSGPNQSPVFMATPAFQVKKSASSLGSIFMARHQIGPLGRNQLDLGQLRRQTLLQMGHVAGEIHQELIQIFVSLLIRGDVRI